MNQFAFRILSGILIVLIGLQSSAGTCPTLPDPPAASKEDLAYAQDWNGVAEPFSAFDWMGGKELAPLGKGRLRVIDKETFYYDWAKHILLPLWHDAEGDFYGWLHHARITSDSEPESKVESKPLLLTGAGMVETDYEHLNLIAVTVKEDGWIQLQLRPGKSGSKWTHQCHLALGKASLAYQDWSAFLIQNGNLLQLRTGDSLALMSEPGESATSSAFLNSIQKFTLHVMKDEWILVETKAHATLCESPDETGDETGDEIVKGWIRWKDPLLGPRIWPTSAGCQ